jgi:PAS domain S-box-containing protein
MKSARPRHLSFDAEVRRVEMLYDRLPSSMVAGMVGIFLCFVVLFDIVERDSLKAWAAFMLSVFAVRLWLWYVFGRVDRQSAHIRRWEWAFAAGAFLTSLGWGALFGPLYPSPAHPDAQLFILLAVLVIAFAGTVFVAMSNISFWLFAFPVMFPVVAHYVIFVGRPDQWPTTAAACCVAILILLQRTLHQPTIENLARSVQAEMLLAEQEAIFESSPLGIAVIDDQHIVKCNARLGELLGRRVMELTSSSINEHFANTEETNHFLADSAIAFAKGRSAQGMYRLHRADGSEFWAEFSGRKMADVPSFSVWMIADVTLRLANDPRALRRGNEPADNPRR